VLDQFRHEIFVLYGVFEQACHRFLEQVGCLQPKELCQASYRLFEALREVDQLWLDLRVVKLQVVHYCVPEVSLSFTFATEKLHFRLQLLPGFLDLPELAH